MTKTIVFILSIGGFSFFQSCKDRSAASNRTESGSYDSSWDAAARWNERENAKEANQGKIAKEGSNEMDSSLNWVVRMYKDSGSLYEKTGYELVYFKKVNDSVSYCLYNVFSGVCLATYLATQVNRRPKENEQVSEGCDTDFSNPYFSYSEYTHDSTRYVIVATEFKEEAKKQYLKDDGQFKAGYDRENVELIRDTSKTIKKIEPSGKITSWEVKNH